MRDSVPSRSYSSVCNVLRQWQSRSSLLIESTDSMIGICGGTGIQCHPGSATYVKLSLTLWETLDAKLQQNFIAVAIF